MLRSKVASSVLSPDGVPCNASTTGSLEPFFAVMHRAGREVNLGKCRVFFGQTGALGAKILRGVKQDANCVSAILPDWVSALLARRRLATLSG